jgi:calcineurin-like phosphoesterase family protein
MILSHIPLHPGSLGRFGVNIHGHVQAARVTMVDLFSDETLIDTRYHCVCVEHTDYTPISFEDVKKRIRDEGGEIGFKNGNGPTM